MTTDDYFANKRVVLFSLPVAFTPICSTQQLPYEERANEIKALALMRFIVYLINDSYVMNACKKLTLENV